MVTSTKPKAKHGERSDASVPDRGCEYAPKCVACPWSTCVKELPASEHLPFVAALKLVRSYLPAPDRTIKS